MTDDISLPQAAVVPGETDLLPCPFCGGPAVIASGEHVFFDAKARCASCGAEGPVFDIDDGGADEVGRNRTSARDAWNTRAARMATTAPTPNSQTGEA